MMCRKAEGGQGGWTRYKGGVQWVQGCCQGSGFSAGVQGFPKERAGNKGCGEHGLSGDLVEEGQRLGADVADGAMGDLWLVVGLVGWWVVERWTWKRFRQEW